MEMGQRDGLFRTCQTYKLPFPRVLIRSQSAVKGKAGFIMMYSIGMYMSVND